MHATSSKISTAPMGKQHASSAVPTNVTAAENAWRDSRTRVRLAPGAVQNWPTKHEEAAIQKLYAELHAAAESEKLTKQKKQEKLQAFN